MLQEVVTGVSWLLASGLVLYFDGIVFSGGPGWRRGINGLFLSVNKGFQYFLMNIIVMGIAAFVLQSILESVILRYIVYIIPISFEGLFLLYVYYLTEYTKTGPFRVSVILFQILIIGSYFYIRSIVG